MPPNHRVTNQAPLLSGHNAFRTNPLLLQIASGFDAYTLKDFDQIGRYCLSPEAQDLAQMADFNPPQLNTHDRNGARRDLVTFHPAYHALMRRSTSYGIASSVWEDKARGVSAGHLRRAIRYFLLSGLEAGHLASLSATNGAVGALMSQPSLANEWVPRVITRKYDSGQKSPVEKSCLTLSYGIAEKQAGTDLSGLITRAESIGNGLYRLSGHKWFLPSPMADAFLILAKTQKGVTCFLVPRFLAGNEHNQINLISLKDALGNRSAATASVELEGAIGQMVGRDGEGAKTIHEMQTLMRLDGSLANASIMNSALSEAVHHARFRKTGPKPLIDQPLMQSVLADMAIDVAGATALSMRLARAFDTANDDDAEGAYAHIMTPVAKYWTGKVTSTLISETMEVVGGNGYVEASVLPRLYRQAPHQSVWEGTGNMMALEVCRHFKGLPALFDSIFDDLANDLGPRAGQTLDVLNAAFSLARDDESAARIAVEQLAVAAAAAELTRLGTGVLADAFIETRLGGAWRASYGMLDPRFDRNTILDALYPPVS